MLQELTIRNFALLEEVRLVFGEGLNVLTGETGAGKSIIIDAIGAVLGGRTAAESVRTGTERATVEAIFSLAPDHPAAAPIRATLTEMGADEDDEANGAAGVDLILAREISRAGRSVARINGRAVPASTLAQVGAHLVDIHGQHEHLSLLRADAQRDLLDRYGGLMPQRTMLAALVHDLRGVRTELRSMQQDEREVARRIDLLSYQIEEIQAAKLQPGEEEALTQERNLLANAARLAELAASVYGLLAGGTDEQPPASELLGQAARDLAALVRIDQEMAPHQQLLVEAAAQVEELGRTMRAYQDSVEFAPDRLGQVEERLELIRTLQRKYGDSIEAVNAFGEQAAADLDTLVNREAHTEELERRAQSLAAQIGAAAGDLSRARAAAGERLSARVAEELAALSLRGHFSVSLLREPDSHGVPVDGEPVRFDDSGVDTVEFLFAPNPGEPAKSVARTASGGELSRVLLALKAVLSEADRTPTLIFDEVDSGIGGRNGQVLGEKLAQLGRRHQVLCVTHLPQIAAYGDTHFYIAKQVSNGRTATTVDTLDRDGRHTELAQMLGGATATTLEQARHLVARAGMWKSAGEGRTSEDSSEAGEAAPARLPALEAAAEDGGGSRTGGSNGHARPRRQRHVKERRDQQPVLQGATP